jgi:hypothetical protein
MTTTQRGVLLGTGVAVLLAAAFLAGLYTGFWKGHDLMMGFLEAEVAGNLGVGVSTLAMARDADLTRVIRILEVRVQSALTSLPQGRAWEEIPESQQRSLLIAKKYLQSFPPQEPLPELEETLARIPDDPIDPDSCSPALRQALFGPVAPGSASPVVRHYCTQYGPMFLRIDGNQLAGVFVILTNGDMGSMVGTIRGRTMDGEWFEPDSDGDIVIRFESDWSGFNARYNVSSRPAVWHRNWVGQLRPPGNPVTFELDDTTLLCE